MTSEEVQASSLGGEFEEREERVVRVSCNCFELVRVESFRDTVFSVILAGLLLAIWIYAACLVFGDAHPPTVAWVSFWVSLAALVILVILECNKWAAVHKIRYKRNRDRAKWFTLDKAQG